MPVSADLSVLLLEAGAATQSQLVDLALENEAPAGDPIDDPYGVVLWPAAQVVSHALTMLELADKSVLELGCGTGLVSLAAAACGARVLATDYREEPFELLRASAARTAEHLGRPLRIDTRLFDIKAPECRMPAAAFTVAADLLYLKSTSVALARRCVEALGTDGCEEVIVGDLGRPGRDAFLAELRARGVRPDAARFEPVRPRREANPCCGLYRCGPWPQS